MKINIRNR